jgi:hypothetical protein
VLAASSALSVHVFYSFLFFYSYRAVATLPHFVNLELNGNQITEAGVDAIRAVLHGAGKILGGTNILPIVHYGLIISM